MQRINNDIKAGTLRPAYLLYGEEGYLIRQYRDKLKNAALGMGDAMNVSKFEGKGVSIPQIIDLAETMPFFADKRVIILENTELFKSGGEQLANYLESPSESCVFIFAEQKIDKKTKLFKAVSKIGYVTEMGQMDELTLKKWIFSKLKQDGKQMSEGTAVLFLEKAGSDMDNIQKELEKLICYCMDKDVITSEDVETICTHQIQNQIFDMVNAIALGKQQQALTLYYDLLALKEPPIKILALLSKQFQNLMMVKQLMMKGERRDGIADKLGSRGFIVSRQMDQAKRFSLEYLKKAFADAVETDRQIKTGVITDQLGIELLILQYSSGQGE